MMKSSKEELMRCSLKSGINLHRLGGVHGKAAWVELTGFGQL